MLPLCDMLERGDGDSVCVMLHEVEMLDEKLPLVEADEELLSLRRSDEDGDVRAVAVTEAICVDDTEAVDDALRDALLVSLLLGLDDDDAAIVAVATMLSVVVAAALGVEGDVALGSSEPDAEEVTLPLDAMVLLHVDADGVVDMLPLADALADALSDTRDDGDGDSEALALELVVSDAVAEVDEALLSLPCGVVDGDASADEEVETDCVDDAEDVSELAADALLVPLLVAPGETEATCVPETLLVAPSDAVNGELLPVAVAAELGELHAVLEAESAALALTLAQLLAEAQAEIAAAAVIDALPDAVVDALGDGVVGAVPSCVAAPVAEAPLAEGAPGEGECSAVALSVVAALALAAALTLAAAEGAGALVERKDFEGESVPVAERDCGAEAEVVPTPEVEPTGATVATAVGAVAAVTLAEADVDALALADADGESDAADEGEIDSEADADEEELDEGVDEADPAGVALALDDARGDSESDGEAEAERAEERLATPLRDTAALREMEREVAPLRVARGLGDSVTERAAERDAAGEREAHALGREVEEAAAVEREESLAEGDTVADADTDGDADAEPEAEPDTEGLADSCATQKTRRRASAESARLIPSHEVKRGKCASHAHCALPADGWEP